MTAENIEQAALALSPAERERLAHRLMASLDDAPLTDIDEAWIDEAERRLDELLSGKVQGVPHDQMFDRIRRDLGWAN